MFMYIENLTQSDHNGDNLMNVQKSHLLITDSTPKYFIAHIKSATFLKAFQQVLHYKQLFFAIQPL